MTTSTVHDVDLDVYLDAHEESTKVVPAWLYVDAVKAHLADGKQVGLGLPWSKTHENFRLRRGEVTVWAGVNGHGKSMLLSQVVLQSLLHGQRACIASLEMRPEITLSRMCRQCGHGPVQDVVDLFHDWLTEKLWLYDQQGTVEARRMVGLARYCGTGIASGGTKLPIHHLVIDSLMKCGLGVDDYNGQKAFVNDLCAAAMDFGLHIHLVAHARKGDSERKIQDKFDIKGTSEITDQVDNVFTLWRNKRKEDDAQKPTPDEGIQREPDALLICSKQRHGEWEGKIALWYDRQTMQYVAMEGGRPYDFLAGYDPEAAAERRAIQAENA